MALCEDVYRDIIRINIGPRDMNFLFGKCRKTSAQTLYLKAARSVECIVNGEPVMHEGSY